MLPNPAEERRLVTISEQDPLILCVDWAEKHKQLNTEPAWTQMTSLLHLHNHFRSVSADFLSLSPSGTSVLPLARWLQRQSSGELYLP